MPKVSRELRRQPAEIKGTSVQRFSGHIPRKPFSESLDPICASAPESNSASLRSLSATCRHSAVPEKPASTPPPLLLLAVAAARCTWIPRPATFDRSDCFQRPSSHTTAGPYYPSRLLLPSLPTITTTTNSPYRFRHLHSSPPSLQPSPSLRLHISLHLRCPVATRLQ